MPVRKLTLSEWFLSYQMRKMARDHVHLPAFLDIDITELVAKYGAVAHGDAEKARPPITAIVVKATALAGRRVSELNIAYFRTFYGDRIVQFDDVVVNVPVLLVDGGKRHLSIKSIRNADRMEVDEIDRQIQAQRKKAAGAIKLVRHLATRSNNFFSRTLLKLIHFVVFHFPRVFEKNGGGAFSVSSILSYEKGAAPLQVPAYGPTAVSISLTGLVHDAGRTILRAGAGLDHTAIDGFVARKYTDAFYAILAGIDPEGRAAFGLPPLDDAVAPRTLLLRDSRYPRGA